jgi:hypothetical protein
MIEVPVERLLDGVAVQLARIAGRPDTGLAGYDRAQLQAAAEILRHLAGRVEGDIERAAALRERVADALRGAELLGLPFSPAASAIMMGSRDRETSLRAMVELQTAVAGSEPPVRAQLQPVVAELLDFQLTQDLGRLRR